MRPMSSLAVTTAPAEHQSSFAQLDMRAYVHSGQPYVHRPGMTLNSADTPDQEWGLDTDNVLSP